MLKLLPLTLLSTALFASGVQFDSSPEFGFRWDTYSLRDHDDTTSNKVKFHKLGAVTVGYAMRLVVDDALYLGVRGQYGVVVTTPEAKVWRNDIFQNDVAIDKKYTIDADGVMGYQFHFNDGNVIFSPQVGYNYSKYKLSDTLVAPAIEATSIGAFAVANGGPYAGLKTIWICGNSNVQLTTDYFYTAFRHDSPMTGTTMHTQRSFTFQGPRVEFAYEYGMGNGWFFNLTYRGRYLFTGDRKIDTFPAAAAELEDSYWMTNEGFLTLGYAF